MKTLLIILTIALIGCRSAEDKRISLLQDQYTANLIQMEIFYQKAKRESKKALICKSDSSLCTLHETKSQGYIILGDSLKDLNEEISLELLRLREL